MEEADERVGQKFKTKFIVFDIEIITLYFRQGIVSFSVKISENKIS